VITGASGYAMAHARWVLASRARCALPCHCMVCIALAWCVRTRLQVYLQAWGCRAGAPQPGMQPWRRGCSTCRPGHSKQQHIQLASPLQRRPVVATSSSQHAVIGGQRPAAVLLMHGRCTCCSSGASQVRRGLVNGIARGACTEGRAVPAHVAACKRPSLPRARQPICSRPLPLPAACCSAQPQRQSDQQQPCCWCLRPARGMLTQLLHTSL
jgi:hypothetical protein